MPLTTMELAARLRRVSDLAADLAREIGRGDRAMKTPTALEMAAAIKQDVEDVYRALRTQKR